jgi:ribosomal protein S17E
MPKIFAFLPLIPFNEDSDKKVIDGVPNEGYRGLLSRFFLYPFRFIKGSDAFDEYMIYKEIMKRYRESLTESASFEEKTVFALGNRKTEFEDFMKEMGPVGIPDKPAEAEEPVEELEEKPSQMSTEEVDKLVENARKKQTFTSQEEKNIRNNPQGYIEKRAKEQENETFFIDIYIS